MVARSRAATSRLSSSGTVGPCSRTSGFQTRRMTRPHQRRTPLEGRTPDSFRRRAGTRLDGDTNRPVGYPLGQAALWRFRVVRSRDDRRAAARTRARSHTYSLAASSNSPPKAAPRSGAGSRLPSATVSANVRPSASALSRLSGTGRSRSYEWFAHCQRVRPLRLRRKSVHLCERSEYA
jgi:hypothetical protein